MKSGDHYRQMGGREVRLRPLGYRTNALLGWSARALNTRLYICIGNVDRVGLPVRKVSLFRHRMEKKIIFRKWQRSRDSRCLIHWTPSSKFWNKNARAWGVGADSDVCNGVASFYKTGRMPIGFELMDLFTWSPHLKCKKKMVFLR